MTLEDYVKRPAYSATWTLGVGVRGPLIGEKGFLLGPKNPCQIHRLSVSAPNPAKDSDCNQTPFSARRTAKVIPATRGYFVATTKLREPSFFLYFHNLDFFKGRSYFSP